MFFIEGSSTSQTHTLGPQAIGRHLTQALCGTLGVKVAILGPQEGEAGRAAQWTQQGGHAQVEHVGHTKAQSRVVTTGLGIQGAGCSPVLFLVSLEEDIPLAQLLMVEVVMVMFITTNLLMYFTSESLSKHLLSTSDLSDCGFLVKDVTPYQLCDFG